MKTEAQAQAHAFKSSNHDMHAAALLDVKRTNEPIKQTTKAQEEDRIDSGESTHTCSNMHAFRPFVCFPLFFL